MGDTSQMGHLQGTSELWSSSSSLCRNPILHLSLPSLKNLSSRILFTLLSLAFKTLLIWPESTSPRYFPSSPSTQSIHLFRPDHSLRYCLGHMYSLTSTPWLVTFPLPVIFSAFIQMNNPWVICSISENL